MEQEKTVFSLTYIRVLELDYTEELTLEKLNAKLALYARRHSFLSPSLVVKLNFDSNEVTLDKLAWWSKEEQHNIPYSHIHNVYVFNSDPKRIAIDIINVSTAKRRVFLFKCKSIDDRERILERFRKGAMDLKLYDRGNVRSISFSNWNAGYRAADEPRSNEERRDSSTLMKEGTKQPESKEKRLQRQSGSSLPRTKLESEAESLVDEILRDSCEELTRGSAVNRQAEPVRRSSKSSSVQTTPYNTDAVSNDTLTNPRASSSPVRLILPKSARVSVCDEEYTEEPKGPVYRSSYFRDHYIPEKSQPKNQSAVNYPKKSSKNPQEAPQTQEDVNRVRLEESIPKQPNKLSTPAQAHANHSTQLNNEATVEPIAATNYAVQQHESKSCWNTARKCIRLVPSGLGKEDSQGSRYIYVTWKRVD